MGNLQDTLIETIEKDYLDIKEMDIPKDKRKESNILLKRIETAKNLFTNKDEYLKRLSIIENEIKANK
jgi:hypothetical protein